MQQHTSSYTAICCCCMCSVYAIKFVTQNALNHSLCHKCFVTQNRQRAQLHSHTSQLRTHQKFTQLPHSLWRNSNALLAIEGERQRNEEKKTNMATAYELMYDTSNHPFRQYWKRTLAIHTKEIKGNFLFFIIVDVSVKLNAIQLFSCATEMCEKRN